MNLTDYPDSNPPPCGGSLLTDTDILAMLQQAGAPPHRPEALFDVSFCRSLINHLMWLRPKSKKHRDWLVQHGNRSHEEVIEASSTAALKAIAQILNEFPEKLEELGIWRQELLQQGCPKTGHGMLWQARQWAECEGKLRIYEGAQSKLKEAQGVLEGLSDLARSAPREFTADVERADPECLGRIHALYEEITADTNLSKTAPAVRFVRLAMEKIGWKYPKSTAAIEQALRRERKRRTVKATN